MIDRLTVEKIKEAANIVDVVSEFVTLKKSGANYKGLCPFHNEKTPSFYVSPSRGTCHCFGCGKGGNAVTFIMEHEQMTYPEALRWLARKYHIEIKEHQLTDEEQHEQSKRESMFIVNEWAASYFEHTLKDTADGVAFGMQYFRSRGFRDDTIARYRLGYDVPNRQTMPSQALAKGYNAEYLEQTGLCYKTDKGELISRFAGRVIFPWIGVSGKVVGFSGRVLDSRTKGVNQKYVNSPDSDIYHKDHELYGIYQAKRAITREDCVFMVEGQADVLSMYQCGIENVVANSGTALSIHQIHMLHRFTSNITLLYDGDAAGIHAALRGTDMLLSEGMNLKVVLLPPDADPDSFARSHTAEQFKQYISEHQTDFIQFKTQLLLDKVTDPIKRAEGIGSIVASIAVIQNPILRDTYIHDCSIRMGINEQTLINQMNSYIRANHERSYQPQAAQAAPKPTAPVLNTPKAVEGGHSAEVERMLTQLLVKYGERVIMENVEDSEGNIISLKLAQYVYYNLSADDLHFSTPLYEQMFSLCMEHINEPGFSCGYYLEHYNNVEISKAASEMSFDRYKLDRNTNAEPLNDDDRKLKEKQKTERLKEQVDHLLLDFRMCYVEQQLKVLRNRINTCTDNADELTQAMQEYSKMQNYRNVLARQLGSNIII